MQTLQDSTGDGPVTRAMARVIAVARAVLGTLILASIAINFANVVGRYLFLSPIIWAEEVMIYIMVWCVFLGAVLVTWEGRHLRMDLLSTHLRRPWKEIVNLIAVCGLLVASGFVAIQSVEAVSLFARLGQKSTTAGIPMVVPHLAVLVGFSLIFLAALVRFRRYVAGDFESEVDDVTARFGEDGDTGSGGSGGPAGSTGR